MKKSITINEEQFFNVLNTSNKEFLSIDGEKDPIKAMMMGMQNILFGTLIATNLFAEKNEEEM